MAKGFLLLALSIFCILSTSSSLKDCTNENLYRPQANPENASEYYICLEINETPNLIQCPEGLEFNAASKGCSFRYEDSPSNSCGIEGQVIPVQDETCSKYKICKNTGTALFLDLKLELLTCDSTTPVFDPFLGKCVEESDYYQCGYTKPDCDNREYRDTFLAAPDDCNSYYECIDDIRVKYQCKKGLDFDVVSQRCIQQSESACSADSMLGPLTQNICKGKEKQFVADPNYCRGYYYCYNGRTPYWNFCKPDNFFNRGYCTKTRPSNCKCEGIDLPVKEKVHVANGSDKTKYFICQKGKTPVEKKCPSGYLFDADEEACVKNH